MGTEEAVLCICEALQHKKDSELMRHELAYILGQMQNPIACPVLCTVLEDESDNVLVRHEAAEALGAIGSSDSIDILRKYAHHEAREIRETCEIAVELIQWKQSQTHASTGPKSLYLSVDPAPSLQTKASVSDLKARLLDTTKSLFERYRAMFSLRDTNSDEAALALVAGFGDDSALFRHEIAYVLGQMQRPVTVEGLTRVLEDVKEHRMVRHEAAEALGAIGGEEVALILQRFQLDPEAVVKDSCDVALDTIDYWAANSLGGSVEISS